MDLSEKALESVTEKVMSAIQKILEPLHEKFDQRIEYLEKKFLEVLTQHQKTLELEGRVQTSEVSIGVMDAQLTHMKDSLPSLVSHVNKIATSLALHTIDLNMHRRKYSLIIQGLEGSAGEDSDITRGKLVEFAKDKLRVAETCLSDLSACHRLTQKKNSGIIARFQDLSMRDKWLQNAKNLKELNLPKGKNISISVDLPPCLRPVKKQLAEMRKELPPLEKRQSYIKHFATWPYVALCRKSGDSVHTLHHTFSKEQIAYDSLKRSDEKLDLDSIVFDYKSTPEETTEFYDCGG